MKALRYILILELITLLYSCEQQKSGKQTIVIADTLQTNFNSKDEERLEKRRKIEEQDRIDSLTLDKVLGGAIEIANQNIGLDRFKKSYVEPESDSFYEVEIEINSDFYFSDERTHLIIRRSTSGSVFIDIFSKASGEFHKVLSHKQWAMEYVNDTIRDINGDGLKDFVVNWYGSSGCCLKAFSNVFLIRSDRNTFSNNLEFINPTFSPKEKIIRGVCYGHAGETEMYKYKWNGEIVDTLEYISFEKNGKGEKTGKILITTDLPYGGKYKVLKRLNSIPTEYKKIDGYDWFLGSGY